MMISTILKPTALFFADGALVDGDVGMLWMLLSGILVFLMQAGFTLVESGFTESKNAINIAMKNFLDIGVGSLTYWFVGYSLMYGDTNGWIAWSGLMQGEGADLFFQTMFELNVIPLYISVISRNCMRTMNWFTFTPLWMFHHRSTVVIF